MQVWQVLKQKGGEVVTTSPDVTILDVVRRMNERRFGALVVVDEQAAILGIVTERDVMRRCLAAERPDLGVPVRTIMTRQLVLGRPDSEVNDVLATMTERRIRHLPIVEDGRLVGMISIGDCVKSKLDELDGERKHLYDYLHDQSIADSP